jgi:hypothetical protein
MIIVIPDSLWAAYVRVNWASHPKGYRSAGGTIDDLSVETYDRADQQNPFEGGTRPYQWDLPSSQYTVLVSAAPPRVNEGRWTAYHAVMTAGATAKVAKTCTCPT